MWRMVMCQPCVMACYSMSGNQWLLLAINNGGVAYGGVLKYQWLWLLFSNNV